MGRVKEKVDNQCDYSSVTLLLPSSTASLPNRFKLKPVSFSSKSIHLLCVDLLSSADVKVM